MSTEPVAGAPDLVDVNFAVKERPSATVGGGIGYSAYQKFVLNGNFSDSDFFGGGDYVALNVDAGLYNKIYSLQRDRSLSAASTVSRARFRCSYRDSTQFYPRSPRRSIPRILYARYRVSAIRSPSIRASMPA